MNWDNLNLFNKIRILSGETFIEINLLSEDQNLIKMLKEKEPKKECLNYINRNW
jgi:hypothetical protein